MNKRIAFSLIILSIMSLCVVSASTVKASPKTIVVPEDYSTIGWAVGNATDGDTIYVKSGIYNETIIIDKPLSLEGENRETTVIDCGKDKTVVTITQDHVNVTGFTIRNGTESRVGLPDLWVGVHLMNANYCNISGNKIIGNGYGVKLDSSHDNSLVENYVIDNVNGIRLDLSPNTRITRNIITANREVGIDVRSSCNYISIVENNITKSKTGIDCSANFASVIRNTVSENSAAGITVFSSNCSIIENDITNNDKGVWLYVATENVTFYHNNFVNNTIQVDTFLGYGSFWDNGKEGNYWSDYLTKYPNASEIDNSGIGNIPFVIDANNTDHYPLVKQYIIPEFPSWIILPLVVTAMLLTVLLIRRKKTRLHYSL